MGKNFVKDSWLMASTLAFMVLTYGVVFFFEQSHAMRISSEDNAIEYLGAMLFFAAALLFFFASIHTRAIDGNAKPRLQILAILLSCGLLWIALEEISYGQRILGFDTPETLKSINTQREFNLHNLKIVSSESGFSHWLNIQRLFSIFWLVYCVVFPLVYRRSQLIQTICSRLYIPVAPLWLGGAFLLNYALAKVIALWLVPQELVDAVTEIKETNYAFLFACFAYIEQRGKLALSRSQSGLVQEVAV